RKQSRTVFYYCYYYFACHPTMCSMYFNVDHSKHSRKKSTGHHWASTAFCALKPFEHSSYKASRIFIDSMLQQLQNQPYFYGQRVAVRCFFGKGVLTGGGLLALFTIERCSCSTV
ncbi:unnamed protein product, partial [Laminaria digitata]